MGVTVDELEIQEHFSILYAWGLRPVGVAHQPDQ